MCDPQIHKETGGEQNDDTYDKRLRRRSPHIGDHGFIKRQRRGQNLINGAVKFRKENTKRCIRNALRKQGQHREPWHNKHSIVTIDTTSQQTRSYMTHSSVEHGTVITKRFDI